MRVVIIGGGVIGLASAYQLAREGAEVSLVDARETGRGASEVNAGWVCPAESGPVPGPGMVGQALRWMLRRDSPLYVRPSLAPAFLSFMYQLWRHCDAAHHRAGMAALLRLSEGTMELYDAYRADGIEFEMHGRGLLQVYRSPSKLAERERDLDLLERAGLEPRVLAESEARAEEPLLSAAVAGAILFPHERDLDPATLVRGLHRRCLELGVAITEHAAIDGVERRGSRVVAVRAGQERFAGDAFVLAAGAWSGPLSQRFGAGLPLRPGKGYHVDLPPMRLRRPLYLSEARVALTPLDSRLRLAGTMEFGGLDERIDATRVGAIGRAPAAYLERWQPPSAPVAGAGVRPMTPDGLPVIGRLGGLENAYVSGGHAMLGLTLAPASALVVADLILRGRAAPGLEVFEPGRFRR